MPWTRRVELALRGVTLTAAAIAVAALLWPPSLPRTEIAPAGLGASPSVLREVAEADVPGRIAQGNIFSSTRSAPRTRYRPNGSGAEEPGLADESVTASVGVPELYGIVPGPSGAAALMRLDATVEGAQLYREGDRGGRYRVDRIGDDTVVLTGPAGRVELRLGRPEGVDR